MAIDWAPTVATLRARADAGSTIPNVARELADEIEKFGKTQDRLFARQVPPIDSFLVESSAHTTWRTQSAQSTTKLDSIAASVDGKPPEPGDPSGDIQAQWAAAKARATKAAKAAGDSAPLLQRTLAATLPAEPREFTDAYYQVGVRSPDLPGVNYQGDVEMLLARLMEQAAELLA